MSINLKISTNRQEWAAFLLIQLANQFLKISNKSKFYLKEKLALLEKNDEILKIITHTWRQNWMKFEEEIIIIERR